MVHMRLQKLGVGASTAAALEAENGCILWWRSQSNKIGGRGGVCAETPSLSFRSQLYRREICLPPAAKQQIPRETIPRFGMTILWGFFKLHHYQIGNWQSAIGNWPGKVLTGGGPLAV
jgi:hypothetical protein